MAAFDRHDPSLFIAGFALWVGLFGVSVLLPGDAFSVVPLYRIARELGLSEIVVGGTMVANSVVLAWGLLRPPSGLQSGLALLTGALWMFWSLLMLLSGLRLGFFSATATWTFIAAAIVMRTTTRPLLADRGRPAPLPAPLEDQPAPQPLPQDSP